MTVKDAKGRVVATTTEEASVGTSTAFVALKALQPAVGYGTFTFELQGTASISDPDTLDSDSVLGDTITLQVAQLTKSSA